MKLSLRQNFAWTLLGSVIYSASLWCVLVVIAKLGDQKMVGQFSLGLAITAPIIMLTNMQLRSVEATDASQLYTFSNYLGLRLIATAVAMIMIILVAMLSGYTLETTLIIIVIGISKSFEAISDIIFGLLQQHERMDRIAKSLIIEGFLTVSVVTLALLLSKSILIAVVGMAIVWGLQLFFYDLRSTLQIFTFSIFNRQIFTSIGTLFHIPTMRKMFWLAFPLGFSAMLNSLNATIPRFFIARSLGEAQLGIFSALSYMMIAVLILMNTLGQVSMPRLAIYFNQRDVNKFYRLLYKLALVAVVFGVASVLMALISGKWILSLLYNQEYAHYAELFVWLMAVSILGHLASLLNYAMSAAQCFKPQLPLFIFVTFITIIFSSIFIPTSGLEGAVLVMAISFTVQAVGSAVLIFLSIRSSHLTQSITA